MNHSFKVNKDDIKLPHKFMSVMDRLNNHHSIVGIHLYEQSYNFLGHICHLNLVLYIHKTSDSQFYDDFYHDYYYNLYQKTCTLFNFNRHKINHMEIISI